jgi:trehalose 6-phosphate phosphatase
VSDTAAGSGVAELVAPLRANPATSALLFDIDGTLAPIVPDAEDAAVPDETRELLRELAPRYALTACVTGRRSLEARRIVGTDELVYAGNHGLELLRPGADNPEIDPAVAGRARRARDFVLGLAAAQISEAGLRLENKGPIQALHWRGAEDERAAEGRARELAAAAGRQGLEPRWGRKVLELRPVGGGGKGAAVGALLAEDGVAAAIYGGDDRTDLDAFRRLHELLAGGELSTAVCIGVDSSEAPSELADETDALVPGPSGWLAVLRALAG